VTLVQHHGKVVFTPRKRLELRSNAPLRDSDITLRRCRILVCLYHGLRRSEAESLGWQYLDQEGFGLLPDQQAEAR